MTANATPRSALPAASVIGVLLLLSAGALHFIAAPAVVVLLLAAVGVLLSPRSVLVVLLMLLFRDPTVLAGRATPGDLLMLVLVLRSGSALSGWRQQAHARGSLAALALIAVLYAVSVVNGSDASALLRLALMVVVGFILGTDRLYRLAVRTGLSLLLLLELGSALLSPPMRLTGMLVQDPAQIAAVASMVFVLWAVPQERMWTTRSLQSAAVIALVWSLTRGAWFAFAFSVSLARRGRAAPLVTLAGVPLAAYLAFGFARGLTERLGLNRTSIDYRASSIRTGYRDFLDSPLIGNGWSFERQSDAFGAVTTTGASYNLVVYVAAAAGLIGLAVLILSLALLALESRNDSTAFGLLLLFVASSMTEMPLYPQSFIGLLGLALVPAAVGWSRGGALDGGALVEPAARPGGGRQVVADDMVRRCALGSFESLLRSAILRPAMLCYLDNARSSWRNPNENLGRELLEERRPEPADTGSERLSSGTTRWRRPGCRASSRAFWILLPT